MAKFAIIAAAEVINMIASVARSGAEFTQAVQDAALQVIAHAVQHGDVTLADRLLASVRPHQKACLVAFLEANGPFRYQKQTKVFEKNKSWAGKFDPETTPHWEKAKAPPAIVSMYDVDEAFDQFLKTARGRIAKAQSTKNIPLLEALENAQAVYNASRMQDDARRIIAKEKDRLEQLEEVQFPALKVA